MLRQIVDTIDTDVQSRPSATEFEVAYQSRVVIDRIKFAIKHTEQFARPCDTMREVGLELLDALERLEALDRRFQVRSRMASGDRHGREIAGGNGVAR
jgi:hypothetical protein